MTDKTRERETPPRVTTVLDPLRPAVVRRRVVDATIEMGTSQPRTFSTATSPPQRLNHDDGGIDEDDEDEFDNGPPSSVNVARALASLRVDELQRVEALLEADDEEERRAAAAAPAPIPAVPTVAVGKEITLAELARRMSLNSQELVTTLVSRGFYSMTAKTVLPRETARVIAEAFGWQIENAPESEEPVIESSPANSAVRAKKKSAAKAKTAPTSKKSARHGK